MGLPSNVITDKKISNNSLGKQADLESILLTKADDIQLLLKKIHSKHSLLTITLEGSEEYYGSTIIEFNEEGNYLVIDEIYPKEGHDQIEIGKQLNFNTQHAGAFVYFKSHIEAIGENEKAAYYKIHLPKEVEYHQRRNTYRISASISEPIAVNLVNEEEILIKAELRDISHGGLCLRIHPTPRAPIQSGDYIPTCLIQPSKEKKIISSLNICHVETIEETGTLRIGAEFANISRTDRRELENLISSLERAIIKKIKRTDNVSPIQG